MATWPTTKQGIRARIALYRRILLKEFAVSKGFGDGYGKRYWLFHLYYLLREEADVRSFIDWYAGEFPNDIGEVGQFLCWALLVPRLGRDDEALYRLVQAINENLPAVAKVIGDSQAPYGIWGDEVMGFGGVVADITHAMTADERRWLATSWHSPAVAAMRHRHVAVGRALVTVQMRQERGALMDEQRAQVQSFKPAEMSPHSTGASRTWLLQERSTKAKSRGSTVIRTTPDVWNGRGR